MSLDVVGLVNPKSSDLGSMVARVSLIVLLIGVWILVHPEPSYACLCIDPGPTPAEGFSRSTSVFRGQVVSVIEFDPGEPFWGGTKIISTQDPTTVEFLVETVWKGPLYQTRYLTTFRDSASCGFPFVEGVTYVVYSADGLSTYMCDRTRRLSEATDDLEYLGRGYKPVQSLAAPTPDLSEHRTGGCGLSPHTTELSAIGMVAGIVWIALRRKRSGLS